MIEPINRNAKFLIIDDQDANLLLLERILKQGGYSCCRRLSDSRQAVSAYREYQPDLVLLDLTMPHLDGVGVMEQLRRAPLRMDGSGSQGPQRDGIAL